ncbi:MAG: hypothetical protein QOH14_1149, partial [Pseudonocardiales bacterium]|nr:hypothetical protein [Pseudonocardiales bacterium]
VCRSVITGAPHARMGRGCAGLGWGGLGLAGAGAGWGRGSGALCLRLACKVSAPIDALSPEPGMIYGLIGR